MVFENIVKEIQTPAYVFDESLFLRRIALVKEHFNNVNLCFSIKANPFLIPYIPDSIKNIEVCSPGELTICEHYKVDMKKVIYSGVNKGREDVSRAIDDGVGMLTAESILHLEMINDASLSKGLVSDVLLRLTAGSQFGMDETDFIDIIRNKNDYRGVNIIGIHYFSGTQKRKAAAITKELNRLDEFLQRLKAEFGFEAKHVEYGTGLAVDYFTDEADALEEERLAEVGIAVSEFGKKYGTTIEMGRFFAATCGYYFTKVADVKTNCGVDYAICDGGMNQLKYHGQMQGMQVPEITLIKQTTADNKEIKNWTLCGSLCTTADVLARNVPLEGLSIGDVLVFHRTGAYSVCEGISAFLSREMPMVAMLSCDNKLTVLRDFFYTDKLNCKTEV